jgi:transcriptional regulator with GAF, ATPase, and Fis domain
VITDQKRATLVGISAAIRDVLQEIERAAHTDTKVLITGESGVGKEIAARLVHEQSRRAARPLVTLNCAGIPDSLLESELFGHVRGSFTGAFRDRAGLLDLADGGSLFLDEVGEMSLRLQAALLRFLETGEIQRVGSDSIQRRVDVRVIAATNRNLLERIAAREFREDLYYRLNVINVVIPPLRERREDIAVLLHHFFQAHARDRGVPPLRVTPAALSRLVDYDWPGNVRQLRNTTERIIVRAQSAEVTIGDLPPEVMQAQRRAAGAAVVDARPTADVLFERMVAGGESFWGAPYAMFMARDLTREDMRGIIERGLQRTVGNYKALPNLFNIPTHDYKRLLSFLRQHRCHVPFQQFRQAAARQPAAKAPLTTSERRWPRKHLESDIPAHVDALAARMLDVSYGGFKLALPEGEIVPAQFDLTLPLARMTVKAQRVWMYRAPTTNQLWCGGQLRGGSASADPHWRAFVDTVR